MFAKQVANGRELPKKVWHLPSLANELYNGGSIDKRRLFIEKGSSRGETLKYGEKERVPCIIVDRENHYHNIAEGVQVTNLNGKQFIEITSWDIKTNAQYIIEAVKAIYHKDPDKAKREYDRLTQLWDIPNPSFDKDITQALHEDKKIAQEMLAKVEKHVVPILNSSHEFWDETKFSTLVEETLNKLGLSIGGNWSDDANEFFVDNVWEAYGLNEHGTVIKATNRAESFSSIFMTKKLEVSHRRIKEKPAGGVSSQHWTKFGPMSESEGDWED
jgi:hypothetical protein